MSDTKSPLLPGEIFHIYTRANGKDEFFKSDHDFNFFMERYFRYILPISETFAYCQMPNHFHFMVRFYDEEVLINNFLSNNEHINPEMTLDFNFEYYLSKQFSNMFNAYCKYYNLKYDRKGSLFNPNFNRKLITSEDYFVTLVAYIHNNPIHHGFVDEPCEWPYSSWHHYKNEKTSSFINTAEVLEWFGGKAEFERFHKEVRKEM